ncbi:alpha/beta-hydrolase [Aspergillus pseudonomiae]|uniref:Alpha/beta-hydrolase n=1 Tax=Aspergillus pseudonomiae TaxID=1506151 RepID=A0A5N7DGI9_9EURO|nr:alpha/beta-hydrolase [Aspergillus pseudonomiae]KAE8405507.1 alpha/beta-hydrolase [Aspergillus pseudonomiae]
MAAITGATFGEKFADFNVIQATYKQVHGHDIRADVLVPKSLSARGPRPVIARFHGGGLSCADSLYADWFPRWLLELSVTYNAIIVSANYRLLPEATGLEILEDVDDFWSWLHSDKSKDLLAAQDSPIELDLNRVLAAGDSAGGLLSIYLTLSYPDQLRAGTATYPQLSWDDPPLYPPQRSSLSPYVPESVIEEYIANIKPGDVVSSDPELRRATLGSALSQHRRSRGFYLRDSETSPRRNRLSQLARLDLPDTRLPRGGLVILHGIEDDDVLSKVSERFVDKAREVLRGRQGIDKLVLSLQPGGHGFDVDVPLAEGWLSSALKGALDAWLE